MLPARQMKEAFGIEMNPTLFLPQGGISVDPPRVVATHSVTLPGTGSGASITSLAACNYQLNRTIKSSSGWILRRLSLPILMVFARFLLASILVLMCLLFKRGSRFLPCAALLVRSPQRPQLLQGIATQRLKCGVTDLTQQHKEKNLRGVSALHSSLLDPIRTSLRACKMSTITLLRPGAPQ